MSGETKPGILAGFKEFILRGNVLDLAVAVVIGAAFTAIVNAIVTGIFNPAIGALFNAESLSGLVWHIPTTSNGTADIAYGAVLAAILQFLIVAVVVYFALVVPINNLKRVAFARRREEEKAPEQQAAAPLPPTELELLAEIRDLLARQADAAEPPATTGKHAVLPGEASAS